jgi:hypothetical protein
MAPQNLVTESGEPCISEGVILAVAPVGTAGFE